MQKIVGALGFRRVAKAYAFALAIAAGILNAALLYLIGTAGQLLESQRSIAMVAFLVLILIFAGSQRALASLLANQSEQAHSAIRLRLLELLQQTKYAEFERLSESEIRALVTHDAMVVAQFWPTLVSLVVSSVTIILCVGYLAWSSPLQLFAVVVGLVVTIALYVFETTNLPEMLRRARDTFAELADMVTDMLDGAKELKIDRRRRMIDFWPMLKAVNVQHMIESAAAKRKGMMAGATGNATFFLLIGVAVFLFHPSMGTAGYASAQFVITLLYLSGPVNRIVNNLPAYGEARAAAHRIDTACKLFQQLSESATGSAPDNLSISAIISPSTTSSRPFGASIGAAQTALNVWRTLRFDRVEYEFQSTQGHTSALGPVSFTIKRGEITFLVGPNGAGKSTIGKLLTGLYKPIRGHILLDDYGVSSCVTDEYRQLFSAIYSDFHLFKTLMRSDHHEERFSQLIDEFQLPRRLVDDRSRNSIQALSDGQRRRLALLMALVEEKSIYFFDEWASDQDPEFRSYFYLNVMKQLRDAGKTVIAISHDNAYFHIADHLIQIDHLVQIKGSAHAEFIGVDVQVSSNC
jgi:putative pyoverdin transport system ATP-binding/permease protein